MGNSVMPVRHLRRSHQSRTVTAFAVPIALMMVCGCTTAGVQKQQAGTRAPPRPSTAGTATPSRSGADSSHTPLGPRPAVPGRGIAASLRVGVLLAPEQRNQPFCTAAVVDSPAGNVIVTAAHCVGGTSGPIAFAPGYRAGQAPIGTWQVTSSYLSAEWQANSDPDADYAFLVVAPQPGSGASGSIEAAAGGDQVGLAPSDGDPVTVIGYPTALTGRSLQCTTTVRMTAEFPTLDCAGFSGGTSGGPLISHVEPQSGTGVIVGVIGGLKAGGCTTDISYASPFTAATLTLLHNAETNAEPSGAATPAPATRC